MVVPGKKDNVIDLSLAPMQFVDVNDCKSFETAANCCIKEEPLVVKHENTSFKDEHFSEESALLEDMIIDKSNEEQQSSFVKKDNHDINFSQVIQESILMAVPEKKENLIDLSLATMQFAAVNDCKSIETAAVTIKEEPLVVKHENTSFKDENFSEESAMLEDIIIDNSNEEQQSSFINKDNHDINFSQVAQKSILMAVPGKKENVIDLSLATMQFAAVNDCKSIETAAVTIKEEPLVVKHVNTSFEDERFIDEITMHEDTMMGDSNNKRRSPFEDNTDHDLNLQQYDKSRELIFCKQNVASLSQTHYDYKVNVRNASHENNKLEQVQQYVPTKNNTCNRECNSKSQLIMHMHTHTGEKPFKCMECDRDFSEKGNLKRHIMVTHTEEKPYKCKECDKGFAVNRYLKIHMLKHTGEKPYACNKCYKGFPSKCQLKVHVRRKHTEYIPHILCELCKKRFTCKSVYINHMRTHTGEKPFKCNECDQGFSEKGNLVRHMVTHTGEKPFKCKECVKSFARYSYLKKHLRQHLRQSVV